MCIRDSNGTTTKIKDIITRVAIRNEVRNRDSLFAKHNVKEGETPESVAYDYYGNANYHWIVLMMNKIDNRYYGWPLSERNLQAYVNDTYADPDATHHYEAAQTSGDTTIMLRVESDFPSASAVTNIQYERTLNDSRKQIKLLNKNFVGQFVSNFNALLQEV